MHRLVEVGRVQQDHSVTIPPVGVQACREASLVDLRRSAGVVGVVGVVHVALAAHREEGQGEDSQDRVDAGHDVLLVGTRGGVVRLSSNLRCG